MPESPSKNDFLVNLYTMTASELLRFAIDPKRRIIAEIKQKIAYNVEITDIGASIINVSYRGYLKKINILVWSAEDIISLINSEIYLYLQLLDKYPNLAAKYQKYVIKTKENTIYYVVISNDTYILYSKSNNLVCELKNTKDIVDLTNF
jgi:hypothetical protein